MHMVLLRRPSRNRWNALFWGGGFSGQTRSPASEGAKRWFRGLVERHLPTIAAAKRPLHQLHSTSKLQLGGPARVDTKAGQLQL